MNTIEKPTCKTCGFYENNCPFIRGKFIPYPNKACKDYTFSTLKAEQEPVSEELGEEIERASKRYPEVSYAKLARIAKRFAEWSAEWQKEQMMKGAVEGRVISNDGISFPVSNEIHRLKLIEGDKVRIIILPKED